MSNTLLTIGACERSSYNGQPSTSYPIHDENGTLIGEIQGEYFDDRNERAQCASSDYRWRVEEYTVSFWGDFCAFPEVTFCPSDLGGGRAALSAAKAFAKKPGPYAVRVDRPAR